MEVVKYSGQRKLSNSGGGGVLAKEIIEVIRVNEGKKVN